jgi:excinuclease ABC subunit C
MGLNLYRRIECNSESRALIPSKPGIYRFINRQEKIIYIGATKNLKKRVSQYFNKIPGENNKKDQIKNLTQFIEFQEYNSQESAFEAERIEIWTNRPRLNIRNNRVYSFSYIILRENPHKHIICANNYRNLEIKPEDKIIRINTHLNDLLEKINLLRKIFPFCIQKNQGVCWDNQINLCNNECNVERSLSSKDSKNIHLKLLSIFSSKEDRDISELEKKMRNHLKSYNFEEAKKIYHLIQSIKGLQRRYGGIGIIHDKSTFYFKENKNNQNFSVEIKLYQKEKLVLRKNSNLKRISNISQDILILYFIQGFYQKTNYCPNKIFMNLTLHNEPMMTFKNWMQRFFQKKIDIQMERS